MDFKIEQGLDFDEKRQYIYDKILIEYGKKAEEMAKIPISISESNILMPIEIEMCEEILNVWEINKYNTDIDYILKNTLLIDSEKFIYKILLGKILRLIPAGVTIISIGLNASLTKRLTLALGYAMSELSAIYIKKAIDNDDVDVLDIFNKNAIEDFMEIYLIEYNKTVLN